MAKFNECSEAERIVALKDQFIKSIEELLSDPSKIQKEMEESKFNQVMSFVPSLKLKDCGCGLCVDMSKLENRIPPELEPLIEFSRKKCEERNY